MVRKLIHLLKDVAMELVVFVYLLGLMMFGVASPDFSLKKSCFPEQIPSPDAVCHNKHSLATASDLNTMKSIFRECLPIVMLFFGSTWWKRTGLFRPLLTITLVGESLAVLVSLVGVYFWSTTPWIFDSITGLVAGSTGSRQMLTMVGTTYRAKHSTDQNRTIRMSIIYAVAFSAACIATIAGGYLLSSVGYKNLFIIIIILYVFAIFIIWTLLKDEPNEAISDSKCFDLSALKVAFQPGPNKAVIWMSIIAVALSSATMLGEQEVLLYYLDEKFDFTVAQANLYMAYQMILQIIIALLLGPLITKVLKWGEFKSAIVSTFLTIVAAVCMSFARTEAELIAFPFIDSTRFMIFALFKTLISKLAFEDTGIYFSFCTIGEALVPMAILPLYDYIFKKTLGYFVGAFYLASSSINIIVFLLAVLAPFFYKKPEDRSEETLKTDQLKSSQKENSDSYLKSDTSKEASCDTISPV